MNNLNYGVIGNCRSAALYQKMEALIGVVCLISIHQFSLRFSMMKSVR